jgi:hypothetical protein
VGRLFERAREPLGFRVVTCCCGGAGRRTGEPSRPYVSAAASSPTATVLIKCSTNQSRAAPEEISKPRPT